MAINMIDGYDILSVAFTAPALSREWGLTPERVGLLLSAGLAGIALGALIFSFLADTLGRRPVILICITLMSAGMIATAFANDLTMMGVCRVITGLGIGGMAPAAGTLAIEYSPPSKRTLSVALVVIGYPVGATLGGFVAIGLLEHFGWRSVFMFGGTLSTLLLPVLILWMPESREFQSRQGGTRFGDLVRAPLRSATILLCVAYAMFMFSFYFILNWATKFVTDMGLADAAGVSVSSITNLAGIGGGLVLGVLSMRLPLRPLALGVMLLMSVTIALFGWLPPNLFALGAASLVLGFVMWGGSATAYSVIALSYPPRVRASGIGVVITAGRVGSMLGPYTAGVLLQAGMSRGEVTLLLAAPAAVCAVLFACAKPNA